MHLFSKNDHCFSDSPYNLNEKNNEQLVPFVVIKSLHFQTP